MSTDETFSNTVTINNRKTPRPVVNVVKRRITGSSDTNVMACLKTELREVKPEFLVSRDRVVVVEGYLQSTTIPCSSLTRWFTPVLIVSFFAR